MTMNPKKSAADRSGTAEAPSVFYWVLAVAIALLSIRFFLWLLTHAGVIAEEDGNMMLVIAIPVALLTIGKLAPGRISRK